ncbi:MAG: hypothetical protein HQ541_13035 [Mariniphaga sp.]|nr:hypothetical protein [Mariniphaga sp.]
MKRFYSNGKLLLTGEYLVLNGAKALAIPLKVGQEMEIIYNDKNDGIYWENFYKGESWMKVFIEPDTFSSN